MSKKICTVLLLLFCVMGGVLSAVLYLMEDHEGPDIQITKERITYMEAEGTDSLLAGVSAQDNVDGDVTDSLIVEAVYPSADEKKAKVVYAAMDSSNNVSKAQRIVDYVSADAENNSGQWNSEEISDEMTKNSIGLAEPDAVVRSGETELETVADEKAFGAKIALINGSNVAGVSAKWQEKLLEEGYTDVIIGSYATIAEDTVIYSANNQLAEELKEYFPNASVETALSDQEVDVSLEDVEACVVISDKDTEIEG